MNEVSKDQMLDLINNSHSLREIMIKLNLSTNGSSCYSNLKNKIKELGIELPNYNYYGNHQKKNTLLPNEVVFCTHSTYPRHRLKSRIIKQKLIKYECSCCENKGTWNYKELSLHLDHINGINDDNRLENLRFLCPNCHSQTETYGGKSNKTISNKKKVKIVKEKIKTKIQRKRKVERPSYEQLIREIDELGYCGVGRKYGVSDNAIRKWKKCYN